MSVSSIIARGNGMIGWQQMSDEQKKLYLPRVARGEFIGAFAMSEPSTGSDVASLSTRAKKDGDSYLITGNKYWCTFADGADYLGIGPCFPSTTKAFEAHAPAEFLRTVSQEIAVPTFAIGGISVERLEPLVALGVTRVAVASAVIRAADPPRAARELIDTLARLTAAKPA